MADESTEQSHESDNGGTSLSREEIERLIDERAEAKAEAKAKEAGDKAFRHWQSIYDRQKAKEKEMPEGEVTLSREEYENLRRARYESMTPEEKVDAKLEDLSSKLERMEQGRAVAPSDDQGEDSSAGDEPKSNAARQQVLEKVKATGIDTEGLEEYFDKGLDGFFKEVTRRAIAANEKKEEEAEDKEERNKADATVGAKPDALDYSKGGVSREMMRRGLEKRRSS